VIDKIGEVHEGNAVMESDGAAKKKKKEKVSADLSPSPPPHDLLLARNAHQHFIVNAEAT